MHQAAEVPEQTGAPTAPTAGLIPVPKWNDYYSWPPPGGMRHLIFHAETNGFGDAGAFVRVGRRVLVDPEKFWAEVRRQGDQTRQGERL